MEIEKLKRAQQRQEQLSLLQEKRRDLNDLEDKEIKLNLIKEYQRKRLQEKKLRRVPDLPKSDESEPLMDFLSVRNRRGKVKDHNLNTVFGPLGSRPKSNSNSQSRKAANTSGQVFRHS